MDRQWLDSYLKASASNYRQFISYLFHNDGRLEPGVSALSQSPKTHAIQNKTLMSCDSGWARFHEKSLFRKSFTGGRALLSQPNSTSLKDMHICPSWIFVKVKSPPWCRYSYSDWYCRDASLGDRVRLVRVIEKSRFGLSPISTANMHLAFSIINRPSVPPENLVITHSNWSLLS